MDEGRGIHVESGVARYFGGRRYRYILFFFSVFLFFCFFFVFFIFCFFFLFF
ncbi:hypothetical protein HanXRQr2_Chr13g0603911 [Helianthus annuus]|uniref:Uncharacterized protein n=1 Tax=Helianthus annuus TaxID=4232 RepID=A0A9K3EJ03_HELAN|nr:hypothetical protein HanXRQr2_Chr13g0603911 [Helianthus annuus]